MGKKIMAMMGIGNISLVWAETIWTFANWFLLGALIVGVIATFFIVVSGNVKEAALKRDLSEARLEIETLRAKNLEFEKAVSPRTLEQNLTAQKLKPFSDISVLVSSPSDFEPKRTAGQIRFMLLSMAKWKRLLGSLDNMSFPFFDGVVVHIAGMEPQHVRDAADTLVSVLNENDIEARRGYPMPSLGPVAIIVEVGPKPLPKSLRLNPKNIPSDEQGSKMWGNILE